MPARPHLHLRNLALKPTAFRPYSGGKTKHPAALPERPLHARELKSAVNRIAERMDAYVDAQIDLGIPVSKVGLVVTALGIGEQDLWLGDMKPSSPGIGLLAVKPSNGNKPTEARLFVAKESLQTIEKQIDQYGSYREFAADGTKNKKPMRFSLFESMSEFKTAGVADVWVGDAEKIPGRKAQPVETWIRYERREYFYRALERLKVDNVGKPTQFADSIILDIDLNVSQMERLLYDTGAVIEFRPASHFLTDFRRAPPERKQEISSELARRIKPAQEGAPRTVILDSGVSASNTLLRSSLPAQYLRTIDQSWGVGDDSGHGTNMAGVALFPNLADAAEGKGPIQLRTGLESVKIVRSIGSGTDRVSPRNAIQDAVALVERNSSGGRVYSLSATIPGEEEDGRQSATSAAIDQLAWNGGNRTRLFCVAAGNVPASPTQPYLVEHYENRNEEFAVQSPAQAVNALSVGAYTEKTVRSGKTVASAGDLCPVSRTSQAWPLRNRTANKPDVVFEGGNHIVDPGSRTSRSVPETRILTTGHGGPGDLAFTGETSAATAGISGIATRVLARYPDMRAETIRGLIVNGASWTSAMEQQAQGGHEERRRVLDCFGWGVPDESLIQESAANSLTMVIEDEITPFERRDGRTGLKEMKYFPLPWPGRALARLRNTPVKLSCTLSYFIEPDPLADKRARRDRYASHRLRFRLNQPGDTPNGAQSRLNKLVFADDDEVSIPGSDDGLWAVEWRRTDIGTIHQNVWTGPAHELARRGGICVYPVKGWWADRSSPEYQRSVPFSLIISIRTDSTEVDLYAEAVTRVPAHAVVVEART